MQNTINAFGYAWELFELLHSTVCNWYANKPPLDLHILKLSLQYIVKLKARIPNPAFDCVFHQQFENYDKNKACIKSIGFRIL